MLRINNNHGRVLTLVFAGLALFACGGGGGKKVYFSNLEDGSIVESPFKVSMRAENLIVEPATLGVTEGHGHFHIIVNAQLASPAAPMVKDEKHIHYGNGESEALLDLPVGQHTLILQFAKGDHVPYDPPLYQQIQVNVTKRNVPDTTQAKPADSSGSAAASPAAADSLTRLPPADTSKAAQRAIVAGNKKADSAKVEAQKHEGRKKEK